MQHAAMAKGRMNVSSPRGAVDRINSSPASVSAWRLYRRRQTASQNPINLPAVSGVGRRAPRDISVPALLSSCGSDAHERLRKL